MGTSEVLRAACKEDAGGAGKGTDGCGCVAGERMRLRS